ncbi:acyltransferase family protein [Colwelliaceae bacterium 6471]
MHNLNHLTGYRGIAALLVVFYHIQVYVEPYVTTPIAIFLSKGYLAVDFFFILSGFVIAFNYFDRIKLSDVKSILRFYAKRFARVYPLHFLILICYLSIPLVHILTGRGFDFSGRYSVEGFWSGIMLIQTWGGLNEITWNIPAWSISTELLAYILFPLVVIIVKPIYNVFGKYGLASFIALLLFSLSSIFSLTNQINLGENIQSLGIFRCVLEFSCGVCVWLIYHNYKKSLMSYGALLYFLGIGIFALGFVLGLKDYYFVPLSMVIILAGSISSKNFINETFSHRVFIWLGDISYSVYLTHYFVKDWFKMLFLDSSSASIVWILSYVAFVLLLSHYLYKYFEVPSKNAILHKLLYKQPKVE